jgi:hypothetical protein
MHLLHGATQVVPVFTASRSSPVFMCLLSLCHYRQSNFNAQSQVTDVGRSIGPHCGDDAQPNAKVVAYCRLASEFSWYLHRPRR